MTSDELRCPSPDSTATPGAYPPPTGGREPGGLGLALRRADTSTASSSASSASCSSSHDIVSNNWITGLFTGLLTFLYFVAFEITQGWTPGKKVLGLSVHGPGGAPKPTAAQSAIRNSWTLLPIIPFIGGLLGVVAIIVIAVTINSSPTKQGKHDELAGGTQVVKG